MSIQAQSPLVSSADGRLPVTAYVRMSTGRQGCSSGNQLDHIKEYAARRSMVVIQVFEEKGKGITG